MLTFLVATLLGVAVESRIDSVIVYPDQALIIRKASVSVSGSEPLTFAGLTGLLDDNTIRIRAPGLKLGEVQVRPGYSAQPTGPVRDLQDSLDRLNRQDRLFTDEQEVLKAREAFLNSIKLTAPELMSRELGAGRVDATNWGNALNFMTEALTGLKRRQAELELLRKELAKTISAVTQELNRARAVSENRKTLAVDAYAPQPGSFEVTLSYLVPHSVSWAPYYELRAAPSTGSTQVSYFARLGQRTNEDWIGTRVLLSTARPSTGGTAPEPEAWYLDIREPAAYGKAAARPMPAPGMTRMTGAEEIAGEFDAEYAPAPPVETGISLQYAIAGTVSLKSGEDPKKLFVHQTAMPAEFGYYSYPRVQAIAYLRGKLQNSSDYIFLAGPGNTHVGDEFTGRTWLPNIAPGESADLSFGVDDRVKVKRELVKTLTSRSGLLGNRTRVDFSFRTIVENFHSRPVSLRLLEQIPVARNKDISIDLGRLDPKPEETNRELGTFTYKLELQPLQKLVINLVYSVEHPSGKQVSGLY